ncbi:glycoside hydrolase [Eremomyces bilateralis CBS 781.70]|uniref:glucan 1,3-beta-glucosidase n=1 Tax=Eremomyces bilateralis CBS 781.70 TaxID=1392243 RepID=A0A6G1FTL4_9PEZI|nr:glycoside hydrolase [Eremomyces bilateralis CBS 781.70]KAF1809080.1 glycoside hydrolase [Eremomyces bilateralis CBS 781.70]
MLIRAFGVALGATLLSNVIGAPAEFTNFKRQDGNPLKFDYNNKVQGVNLGGWLVLEPWITPSIFEEWADNQIVKDEYTFSQALGKDETFRRLNDHWNSWITEDDFQQIAAAGLNHVRIPIGYWSVISRDGDPYVQGAYEFLGRALDWAQGASLMVIIDLHGAPGSQNGFDNSGQIGSVDWTQGDTVKQTLNAIAKIRDDHADHPAVGGIELLNEPLGPVLNMDVVKQFYMDGWGQLKGSHVVVPFSDAFMGVDNWNDWGDGMWSLMVDTHHYEIFDGQIALSPDEHVQSACGFGNQMASNNKWTISGEWTGAMTDCAKWLNGLGRGARYDGTLEGGSSYGSCDGKYVGSVASLSEADRSNIRRYIEAQLDAFEKASGWIFWTWKTEGAPEWDMQDLLAGGLFPQPLSDRQHPGQCG